MMPMMMTMWKSVSFLHAPRGLARYRSWGISRGSGAGHPGTRDAQKALEGNPACLECKGKAGGEGKD